MYERLWCVSVSKILFSNFWPVTTPCKGEAGTLAVAVRSWYIKKYIYIFLMEKSGNPGFFYFFDSFPQ